MECIGSAQYYFAIFIFRPFTVNNFTVFLLRMIRLLTMLVNLIDIYSFFFITSFSSVLPIGNAYLRIALNCRTIVQVFPVILFGLPPVFHLLILYHTV